MRENSPFDDFVKKQFSDYTPDVPAHIWDNIVAAKRNSKPKGFWMSMTAGGKILLLGLLLLTGGATYYFISSDKQQESITNNNKDPKISNQQNPPDQTKNNSSSPANTTISSAIDHETQTGPALAADKEKDNSALNQEDNKNVLVNDHADRSSVNRNTKNNQSYIQKENGNSNTPKENYVNPYYTPSNVTTMRNDQSSRREYLPFRFNNARDLLLNKIPASPNVKLPECPTLEKDAAANKKYWEIYAGPDYAFENYKSYGDTASANYLEKRKASTKFASAFSAGARYTKVFNNGTSIRAGVNYTQVNEKFTYFNPNEIKFVTVITTRVVIRAPGDTIYINDTLQYQQSGTRVKTTFNRYRNIDIPLVIGYELGNGKIHANINAGAIINVYSWYKGDVLDSLYQPVSITTGKSNSIYQFKNNIGVGFLGSVSLYYRVGENMHILLEPYFRYNLSPMSKQNLNLQQKNNIGGIRAGIRLDLK